ncbi:DNMT3A [Trypoxylus dichotomus]
MVVCSTRGCGLVYCFQCLDDLCSLKIRQTILKEDPWYCFVCNPTSNYTSSLIKSRKDWRNKIQLLFSDRSPVISRPPIPIIKKPIRILSLFDGIATDADYHGVFKELKQTLTCVPILGYPSVHSTFILDTDASDIGIGDMLFQVHDG